MEETAERFLAVVPDPEERYLRITASVEADGRIRLSIADRGFPSTEYGTILLAIAADLQKRRDQEDKAT